ncbi:MAG TPA: hypothetical protein VGN15_12680 [Ktedonobacteraceae bacterium]|nr:hypothetical protein [Ktedonobacteraceae bacterium]
MFIATDLLSLVFIACFLFGFLFFLGTALLGNLGHGHSHVGHLEHLGHVGGHEVAHHVAVGGHDQASHSTSQGNHAVQHVLPHAQGTGQETHTQQQANNQHNAHDLKGSLLSFINPISIVLFLLGFGFFGYVFHNTAHLALPFTLILAGIGGITIAAILLVALSRVFGESEANTIQDVSDRTGLLGKVSITIQDDSVGEIIYVSPGGMRKSIAARSVDGRRIERDTEVVVLNYLHGIAEVDTWEHFMNEEEKTPFDTTASNEDELAKLRSLLEESSPTNTELVMRKDPYKE